jgi:hypothetical protein
MLKRCPHFSKRTSVKPAVLGFEIPKHPKTETTPIVSYNPRRLFKARTRKKRILMTDWRLKHYKSFVH